MSGLRAKGLVGDDFEPADLQALVWFPEKVLYAKMGAKDSRSAPTDYSIEMRKLNEQDGINGTNRNNGPRRPGLGAQHAGRAEGNSPTFETSVLSEIERDQFLGRTRAPPTYGAARQLDLRQGASGSLSTIGIANLFDVPVYLVKYPPACRQREKIYNAYARLLPMVRVGLNA